MSVQSLGMPGVRCIFPLPTHPPFSTPPPTSQLTQPYTPTHTIKPHQCPPQSNQHPFIPTEGDTRQPCVLNMTMIGELLVFQGRDRKKFWTCWIKAADDQNRFTECYCGNSKLPLFVRQTRAENPEFPSFHQTSFMEPTAALMVSFLCHTQTRDICSFS